MNIFDTCARENRIVHGWLLHFAERRDKYIERRSDIEQGGKTMMSGDEGIGHAKVANTTEQKVLQLTTDEMLSDEKWIAFIAGIDLPTMEIERPDRSKVTMDYAVFLSVRREHRFAGGPHGWRQAVARDYARAMAKTVRSYQDVALSENMVTKCWQMLLECVVREAIRKGGLL